VVTNLDNSPLQPSGTVTFQDLTYEGIAPTNITLAADLPLSNGVASVTTSNLTVGDVFLGNHLITATYSGDAEFSEASATLVQKIHASASITTFASFPGPTDSNTVRYTATVAAQPSNDLRPTGQVSFWNGPDFLAQIPLDTNGIASITNSFQIGSFAISARYVSDTVFASSTASLVGTSAYFTVSININGALQLNFTNVIGAPFSVISSTDISLPLTNWTVLGGSMEISPGQFQFTDADSTNITYRFYRVRSP